MKFGLGRLLATPGVLAEFERAGEHPALYVSRHAAGDWGDLDADDIRENEFSLAHNLRLLSAYHLSTGAKIWIITEADRSATTLLLPSEY